MTNKKKATKPKSTETPVTTPAGTSTTTAATTASKNDNGTFTFGKAQLAVLILLSIGISRLMQIGGALTADGTSATNVCNDYFIGEDACQDAAIITLIRYKYLQGIQVAMLVVLAVFQYWKSEPHLQRLNTLLIVTPIALTVWAHFASAEWIPAGQIRRHLIMSIVLIVVSGPTDKSGIPFVSGQKQPYKTLQSLALMTLGLVSSHDAFQLLQPVIWQQGEPVAQAVVSQLLTIAGGSSSTSSATTVLVYFLAIDKITAAAIYLFSWFYMEDQRQRVRL